MQKYVSGIFKTTIVKDIIQKFKIENKDLRLMIGEFLMDNVGAEHLSEMLLLN